MALTPLMVGRLDEGLRRGIKAWSEYLTGHLRVGGRAVRGGRRRREKAAMVGRRGRKTKLTARPHLAERREAASSEGANQKGKRIPVKTRPTRVLGGPTGAFSTCGGSEASGLARPKAEWAARSAGPKVWKKNF
jgi:hypothetical protein